MLIGEQPDQRAYPREAKHYGLSGGREQSDNQQQQGDQRANGEEWTPENIVQGTSYHVMRGSRNMTVRVRAEHLYHPQPTMQSQRKKRITASMEVIVPPA